MLSSEIGWCNNKMSTFISSELQRNFSILLIKSEFNSSHLKGGKMMMVATMREIRLGPFFTCELSIYSNKDEVCKALKRGKMMVY